MKFGEIEIERFKHDTVMLKGKEKIVYIDPFQLSGKEEKADIIICTHEHYDHCSGEDIAKLKKKETKIFGAKGVIEKLGSGITLNVGQKNEVEGIKISAVEAYNIGKKFHPKGLGIGIVVEIDGIKVYHAGDTDLIPEMKELQGKVDVAFLPVGGTYTMNAKEAAKAAETIKPKIAVPMHYGAIVGTEKDAEDFKKLFKGKSEII